jgi:uncharacterized protein YkwD
VHAIKRTVVSLVLAVGSFGLVGFVGVSPASAGPTYANRMESELIASTNRKRVQRDRRAVRSNSCVDRMAESWARHLAETNTFTHRRMSTILSRCNRSYVNENLAKYPVRSGMTAIQVARDTVRLWMESTGHRHNLLSRKARVIGVGVARTPSGNYWVIVQNMAR